MCIVEFNSFEYMEMEYNWMNFLFFYHDWQYSYESIVWDISFYNHLGIGDLVGKNRSRSKSLFKIMNASQQRMSKFQETSFPC